MAEVRERASVANRHKDCAKTNVREEREGQHRQKAIANATVACTGAVAASEVDAKREKSHGKYLQTRLEGSRIGN